MPYNSKLFVLRTLACVKKFFQWLKIYQVIYDCHFMLNSKEPFIVFGQVSFFKMCLNTSQVVPKTYELQLSQLIVGAWCLVEHLMLYVYLFTVYQPTR